MIITGKTIAETWEKSIIALLNSGIKVLTERGKYSLELRNLMLCVKEPYVEPMVSKKSILSQKHINDYVNTILQGYGKRDSVHHRIFHFKQYSVDQYKYVVEKLKEKWYTRRAVICLWDPEIDEKSTHPPGICLLTFYIRNDKLMATAVIRSNDAWLGALPDMIACYKLQEKVANEVSVQVGEYTHFAISYHIYEHDIDKAFQIFGLKKNGGK